MLVVQQLPPHLPPPTLFPNLCHHPPNPKESPFLPSAELPSVNCFEWGRYDVAAILYEMGHAEVALCNLTARSNASAPLPCDYLSAADHILCAAALRALRVGGRSVLRIQYGNIAQVLRAMTLADGRSGQITAWTAYLRDGSTDPAAQSPGSTRGLIMNPLTNAPHSNTWLQKTAVKKPPGALQLSTVLERLVLDIHPSFKRPQVEYTHPPYEFSASGWGSFPVRFQLRFRPPWDDSSIEWMHQLNFDPDTGGAHHFMLLALDTQAD